MAPDRAEEAVAEAFARAWSRWPSVRGVDSPRAWIVRTALSAPTTPMASASTRPAPRRTSPPPPVACLRAPRCRSATVARSGRC
ncbi:sigma factor [Nocardioides luteus]|uniref:sigma factor n=1 Tax=Nocardioides luteus TaxID=1844 RepID=UPI00116003E2